MKNVFVGCAYVVNAYSMSSADMAGIMAGTRTVSVKNVIIGPLAADGIHCLGNCTLDHVWWEDIGEDAATALGPAGTVMNITCGAAYNGSDKTFQFNGRGEMRISNFYVGKAGKLVRSCGDCTNNGGPRRIFVNNVITRDVSTIVGINTNFGDVATFSRHHLEGWRDC